MSQNQKPNQRVKTLDVSKAGKMPGVAYILTPQNAPKTYPSPDELFAWFREAGLAARKARSPRMGDAASRKLKVFFVILSL